MLANVHRRPPRTNRLRHLQRRRIALGHRIAGAKRFLQQDGEAHPGAGGVLEPPRQQLFETSGADVHVPAQNAHADDVAWLAGRRPHLEDRPADTVCTTDRVLAGCRSTASRSDRHRLKAGQARRPGRTSTRRPWRRCECGEERSKGRLMRAFADSGGLDDQDRLQRPATASAVRVRAGARCRRRWSGSDCRPAGRPCSRNSCARTGSGFLSR